MAGFQERWIAGKTVERLEPRRKRPDTSWPWLVYDEACTIYFTDGSSLVLLASDDAIGPMILTNYYPPKRRK